MFFSISLKIGIVLNIIAILFNLVVCFVSNEYKWYDQMHKISTQCRWIGLIYIVLAWFMGDGAVLASGRTTYAQVAHWMSIFSVGWIVVFTISLFSKLWSSGEKMTNKALWTALLYFIVAFLIH